MDGCVVWHGIGGMMVIVREDEGYGIGGVGGLSGV